MDYDLARSACYDAAVPDVVSDDYCRPDRVTLLGSGRRRPWMAAGRQASWTDPADQLLQKTDACAHLSLPERCRPHPGIRAHLVGTERRCHRLRRSAQGAKGSLPPDDGDCPRFRHPLSVRVRVSGS